MTLPPGYRLLETPPALEDYLHLRAASGLRPKNVAQGTGAITGSWTFRHVVSPDGDAVAMGRIIGDGGWYFLVADMATLPEHQGRGLGSAILDSLLADIRERAPQGAWVNLAAEPEGVRLYESRGFEDMAPRWTGMHRVV